jgi:hypothetical protein
VGVSLSPHHPSQLVSPPTRTPPRWLEQELPAAIASRSPRRHITQPELVQLVSEA